MNIDLSHNTKYNYQILKKFIDSHENPNSLDNSIYQIIKEDKKGIHPKYLIIFDEYSFKERTKNLINSLYHKPRHNKFGKLFDEYLNDIDLNDRKELKELFVFSRRVQNNRWNDCISNVFSQRIQDFIDNGMSTAQSNEDSDSAEPSIQYPIGMKQYIPQKNQDIMREYYVAFSFILISMKFEGISPILYDKMIDTWSLDVLESYISFMFYSHQDLFIADAPTYNFYSFASRVKFDYFALMGLFKSQAKFNSLVHTKEEKKHYIKIGIQSIDYIGVTSHAYLMGRIQKIVDPEYLTHLMIETELEKNGLISPETPSRSKKRM